VDDSEMAPQTVTFTHNRPIVNWIVAPAGAALAIYWAYRNDFWQDDWSTGHAGSVAVWLFGILGCAGFISALFDPRVTLRVSPDVVVVHESWLWHSRESRYGKTEVSEPEIVGGEGEDDFHCQLRLSDGRQVTVGSRGSRKSIEGLRDEVLAALRSG